MYAHLTGNITHVGADHAVLDVGGVGYVLLAGSRTLGVLEAARAAGKTTRVHTHLHVREDVMSLFGFADTAEKSLFLMLTSVNGLGPKMGLSLLSTFAPDEITSAIQHNQPATLARASGVGKKLAEKMIVELKDKLGNLAPLFASSTAPAASAVQTDLASALINLGYPPKVAEAAAVAALKDNAGAAFEDLFKLALKKVA
jgi:holliday junction DNA helicase RuvA